MSPEIKRYTVFGVCDCGCAESFTAYIPSDSPDKAAQKALFMRNMPGRVYVVIEGSNVNLMTLPVITMETQL